MLLLRFLKIKKKEKESLDNPFSMKAVNQVCNGKFKICRLMHRKSFSELGDLVKIDLTSVLWL